MSLQDISFLLKKSTIRKDLFLFVFFIPFLLWVLFLLPDSIKNQLILNYENLRVLNLFTTHFIHTDPFHFGNSIIWYLLLIVPIYLLNMIRYQRRGFYLVFGLSMLVVPLLLSIMSLIIKHIYSLPIGTSLGFSGIVSVFIGFLPYSTLNFLKKFYKWKTKISMLFLSILLFTFTVILLIYNRPFLFITVLGLSIASIYISYRESSLKECLSSLKNAAKKNKGIYMLVVTNATLYIIGVLSLFPTELILGENIVDIITHYFGFVLGISISIFTIRYEERGFKQ